MIKKLSFSKQGIIDCLKVNYGIEVAKLESLAWGADIDVLVYKVQSHAQKSYFVKVKRRHGHDVSTIVIGLLSQAGIQHIIPFVETICGQATQSLDDFVLTVFPFIEGCNGFDHHLTNDQWYALGRVLRQIHEVHVPAVIQAKIRQEYYSPKWRRIVRSFYPLIDSESSSDPITVKLLTFMKKHKVDIYQLVDRAEQLARELQGQSFQSVLCHSDLHAGNILIDKNDTFHIVDWDDPILAPKERDLMFIGGGVANVWNKAHEEEWRAGPQKLDR